MLVMERANVRRSGDLCYYVSQLFKLLQFGVMFDCWDISCQIERPFIIWLKHLKTSETNEKRSIKKQLIVFGW